MSTLRDLHDQVLCVIAAYVVPADVFDAPAAAWQPAVKFGMCAGELHYVLGEILREAIPALATLRPLKACERTCWLRALAALRRMDRGRWREVRTLQAARPQTASFTPVQTSPRLSGASMCFVGDDTLAVFGGRSSVSGYTLGNTYLVKISWSTSVIAKWDEVQCTAQPNARCYHTAGGFKEGMVVFGGAGDGGALFNDTWFFKRYTFTLPDGRDCTAACWEKLLQPEDSERPSARSSHICVDWEHGRMLVLHGGIGNSGTMGDTWTLDNGGCWKKLNTSGMHVARAHHIGGVVSDHLLVHSGHGADLLTTNSICALDLWNAIWSNVTWPDGPAPRIDAAASVIKGVGLLIFGGVGADYEFETTDPWVLPPVDSARSPQKICTSEQTGLPQRACCSICSNGPQTFIFGGFDGSEDLNDLWCLNPLTACFHDNACKTQAENADNRTLVLLWELRHRLQGA